MLKCHLLPFKEGQNSIARGHNLHYEFQFGIIAFHLSKYKTITYTNYFFKLIVFQVENMTHLIAACCVLHNVCQNSNYQDEVEIQEEPIVQQPNLGADPTPVQCRDALAEFLDR